MRIGILSDTHDQLAPTLAAMEVFRSECVAAVVHCGDLTGVEVLKTCSELPTYFTLGNHDCDMARVLENAAQECGATCLRWGGLIELHGHSIAVAHGHLTMDLKPLIAAVPDYLFTGHTHIASLSQNGKTRRVNPGALFDAAEFSVAIVDLATDDVRFITIPGGRCAPNGSRAGFA
jgi:putative phosphoesterase